MTHQSSLEEIYKLSEEDFTASDHKKIFTAIRELVKSNTAIDQAILFGKLNGEVKRAAMEFFADTYILESNFKEYASLLKDYTLKRKLNAIAEGLIKSDKTGKELSELAEQEIFKLREDVQTQTFTTTKQLVNSVLGKIEESQSIKGYTGVETGFYKLDRVTDGLQNGEYILIGARPSMGKTALALNMASNIAKSGRQVAFFSLEMDAPTVTKRMILAESLVSDKKIKTKSLNDQDFKKLALASGNLYNRQIHICDRSPMTVSEIKSMCRKLKRSKGLDIVFIDYLQLLRSTEGASRREQVEAVSRDVKSMAKELNVPVVVVSSLSRAGKDRSDKHPVMSDLRETGQIEFDCDLIMFLHREYYYNPNKADPHDAELIIAKHRNGALGKINLTWFAESTLFTNRSELQDASEA
jgi:replicative DNA helicase